MKPGTGFPFPCESPPGSSEIAKGRITPEQRAVAAADLPESTKFLAARFDAVIARVEKSASKFVYARKLATPDKRAAMALLVAGVLESFEMERGSAYRFPKKGEAGCASK